MSERDTSAPQAPAAVYLLADNLDAVLAAGEDLLALTLDDGGQHAPAARVVAERTFADNVRTLEMTIAARTLQARARAADLRQIDRRYRSLIDLFVAGTVPLQEAVADLGDSTASDFHAASDIVSYLRSRRLIAADAPGLRQFGELTVTEGFLIAERIELGPLMDLAATFLDRLEAHYELYPELPAASPSRQSEPSGDAANA